MSKYDKNEGEPQVKKANAKEIKLRIRAKCSKIPLNFKFERTSASRSKMAGATDLDFYSKPIFTTTWTHNQQRSNFIYAVIHDKTYYNGEGAKLGVKESEIYEKFTQLTYSLAEIEQFTERKMFDSYLFDCFVQLLEEEHEERQGYLQASLLEQLLMHNSTPKRILDSINRVGKDIKSVSSKLDSLYGQLKYKQIQPDAFGALREPLDVRLENLRHKQEYLMAMYKRMVETQKYRRRKFLKMAFIKAKRSLNQESYPPVECGTISLCNFYITEYCSWYKVTFKAEIAAVRKLKIKQNRKLKRLEHKKADPRLRLLIPFLNSDLSYQHIANETQIPKSTVRNLLKKLA